MYSKETKRWLRAVEIAKILFEEHGYHCLYLDGIENFIRRKTMYSPKIKEDFIPALFKIALSKKIPMTKLVNRIVKDYLQKNHQPEGGAINHESEKELGGLQRNKNQGHHQRDPAPLRPGIQYETKKG